MNLLCGSFPWYSTRSPSLEAQFCPARGHQTALALNGQRVLKVMVAAAAAQTRRRSKPGRLLQGPWRLSDTLFVAIVLAITGLCVAAFVAKCGESALELKAGRGDGHTEYALTVAHARGGIGAWKECTGARLGSRQQWPSWRQDC